MWGVTKNKRRQKPKRTKAKESTVHAEFESGDPNNNIESNDGLDSGGEFNFLYTLLLIALEHPTLISITQQLILRSKSHRRQCL